MPLKNAIAQAMMKTQLVARRLNKHCHRIMIQESRLYQGSRKVPKAPSIEHLTLNFILSRFP